MDEKHPISFSVLRLSKPDLLAEIPLKLSLEDDIQLEEKLTLNETERSRLVAEEGFTNRIHLSKASQISGLNGWIQLPTHIGNAYLGESFSCYISAFNNSNDEIQSLEIRVEMVNARAQKLIFENSDSPINEFKPEDCKNFIVCYDVKDVGEHTLRCLVSFATTAKERITFSSQLLRFSAKTPVLIRTKVRSLDNSKSCILETCLESLKDDEPLILDYVHFEPVNRFVCTPITVKQNVVKEGPLAEYINDQLTKIMSVPHCSRNFLFRLDSVAGGSERSDPESKALGKLEIRWRSRLGSTGKLQTQQIQGIQIPTTPKEVTGRISLLPLQPVVVYCPFNITIHLENCTDEPIGPILLTFQDTEDKGDERQVKLSGKTTVELEMLDPEVGSNIHVSMIALKSGVQSLRGLKIVDKTQSSIIGVVDSHQIFIHPCQH